MESSNLEHCYAELISEFALFFFNDTATTEIYTLSLHDALPTSPPTGRAAGSRPCGRPLRSAPTRSEEHTSELQSHSDLVCRLLLEKKNTAASIKGDSTSPI